MTFPKSFTSPAIIIVAYILLVISMFAAGGYYYINTLKVRVATETARSFDSSLVTIQNFYSTEIVPRAQNAGVELAHDYHDQQAAIPFPATFTMDVGAQFSASVPGLSASMYSDKPFPWRADRVLDAFELASIEALRANPDEAFIQVEEKDGRTTARYASAVILKESCIGCHNQPEYHFGKTWQVGDFRGVRQVIVPLSNSAPIDRGFYLISGGFMLIAALIGGLIVMTVVRRLGRSHDETIALAAELELRNMELIEKSIAKDAFLANTSHELRTPLNAVLGYADMLRMSVFGPIGHDKYREYVEDIHSAGTHLHDMIEDLLDLSRIETGEMELKEQEIDVASLLADIEAMTVGVVTGANMNLKTDVSHKMPALIGDERAVRQILVNLISNAAQHSRGRNIKVSAAIRGGKIEIGVRDDGVGIKVEDFKRLNERFFRGADSDKQARGGLGIGLALVDNFVKLHGAELDIDSTPGAGAAFVIVFPIERTVRPENVYRLDSAVCA